MIPHYKQLDVSIWYSVHRDNGFAFCIPSIGVGLSEVNPWPRRLVGPSRVMTSTCSRFKLVPEDISFVGDDD